MKKYIYLILTVVLAAGTVLTLHDMQVSEGIGLYLAMQSGYHDRRIFDILADIVVLLMLAVLLGIPFRKAEPKTMEQFFRITVCYLALMPGINTAYVLHLFTDFSVGEIAGIEEMLINAENMIRHIRLLVPFTVLLGGMYCFAEGQRLKRKHKLILGIASVLLLLGILWSGCTDILCFAAMYCLMLTALDFWQKLSFASWPVYCILFLRCIYNFYDIMAKYN